MSAESEKAVVAEAAAGLVEDALSEAGSDFILGLGTGTTASLFVRALGRRRLDLTCVSTSAATAALARGLGMRLLEVDAATHIDLVVDGADEIAPDLALTKGGGGALLREKLVWESAARRVVIADGAKKVPGLGAFPLPVEVVDFAAEATRERIRRRLLDFGLDRAPALRMTPQGPFRTDQGNLIYDLACGAIEDPEGLARALKLTTGVVEHGLFLDLADEALIATGGGVEQLRRGGGVPTWTAKAQDTAGDA